VTGAEYCDIVGDRTWHENERHWTWASGSVGLIKVLCVDITRHRAEFSLRPRSLTLEEVREKITLEPYTLRTNDQRLPRVSLQQRCEPQLTHIRER
jgi:hypothetical protein